MSLSMWRMLLPCGKLISLLLFCLLFLIFILFFKPNIHTLNTFKDWVRSPCNGNHFSSKYICLWTKKNLNRTLEIDSNIRSRTSRRIYRLALPLRTPETLSSLSKSRISIFNAHLTLFVRRMTSHKSIGKYRHLVN